MADKEFESDDPYEFVAMSFPVEPGTDADEVMARCFIEEYALMGMPRQKTMRLFASPQFAGTYAITFRRGRDFIERLVDQVYGQPAGGN